jgi:hypothetical protein
MSVRTQLLALLTQSFPQPGPVVLLEHPTAVDAPAKPTIMLRLDTVDPGAARGVRAYGYALVLLVPATDSDLGDNALEALVDQALAAVDRVDPNLAGTWEQAKRGTYRGTTPAFEIPVAVHVAVTI